MLSLAHSVTSITLPISTAVTRILGVTCNGAKAPAFLFINHMLMIAVIIWFRSKVYPVLLAAMEATKKGRREAIQKVWHWSIDLLAISCKASVKTLMMNVRLAGA